MDNDKIQWTDILFANIRLWILIYYETEVLHESGNYIYLKQSLCKVQIATEHSR